MTEQGQFKADLEALIKKYNPDHTENSETIAADYIIRCLENLYETVEEIKSMDEVVKEVKPYNPEDDGC